MVEYLIPTSEDIDQIIAFYKRVGGETSYLSYDEGECPYTAKQLAEIIDSVTTDSQQFILVVKDEGEIVGLGMMKSPLNKKNRHVTELSIVVQYSHQSKGIGLSLMKQLIRWAQEQPYTTKVVLVTRADNAKAFSLFVKLGFIVEGTLKNETKIGERYYDVYIMSKMLY